MSRQVYYGGTFIGNHVHGCLKVYNVIKHSAMHHRGLQNFSATYSLQPQNTETLHDSIVLVAEQNASELLDAAVLTAEEFRRAFSLFANCHLLYDSGKILKDSDIIELGNHVRQ